MHDLSLAEMERDFYLDTRRRFVWMFQVVDFWVFSFITEITVIDVDLITGKH